MLQETIKEFLKKGKVKEADLIQLLESKGAKVDEASPSEDMKEHWDIKIISELKIDVKGLKKSKRADQEPNENIHWLEFLNVNGEKGSLYGEADIIAFETIDYWALVERERLVRFAEEKCKDKIKTDNPADALYKLYTRNGRKDVITKVKSLDIFFLADTIVKKI